MSRVMACVSAVLLCLSGSTMGGEVDLKHVEGSGRRTHLGARGYHFTTNAFVYVKLTASEDDIELEDAAQFLILFLRFPRNKSDTIEERVEEGIEGGFITLDPLLGWRYQGYVHGGKGLVHYNGKGTWKINLETQGDEGDLWKPGEGRERFTMKIRNAVLVEDGRRETVREYAGGVQEWCPLLRHWVDDLNEFDAARDR